MAKYSNSPRAFYISACLGNRYMVAGVLFLAVVQCCLHLEKERNNVSPQRRWHFCLLISLMKISSSLGTNVGQVCLQPIKQDRDSLNLGVFSLIQLHSPHQVSKLLYFVPAGFKGPEKITQRWSSFLRKGSLHCDRRCCRLQHQWESGRLPCQLSRWVKSQTLRCC